jgi:hypothetical protein
VACVGAGGGGGTYSTALGVGAAPAAAVSNLASENVCAPSGVMHYGTNPSGVCTFVCVLVPSLSAMSHECSNAA